MRTLLLIKNGVDDVELLELDLSDIENVKSMIADIDMVDLLRYFTALADYKASVRQGQDPVYSFEATLVKMASMDRAVKLESLLNRLPGTPSPKGSPAKEARETPKSAKLERAAMYPEMLDYDPLRNNSIPDNIPAIETPKIEGELDLESVRGHWTGFCDAVGRGNKAVSSHLRLCKPSKFESGQLTLALDSVHALLISILSKPDKKRLVETSLKEYFNAEIKVILTQINSARSESGEPYQTTDPDKLFEGAPDARELFEKLGGEIIGN
jgi:hypothetical protein